MNRRGFFGGIAALCLSPTLPAVDIGTATWCGVDVGGAEWGSATIYGTIIGSSEWYPLSDWATRLYLGEPSP